MNTAVAGLLGALTVISLAALAGVLYLDQRLRRFEGAVQAIVQDYDTTLDAIKDSLAELDGLVADVDETVSTIRESPLVQSLLAKPAQEEGGDG